MQQDHAKDLKSESTVHQKNFKRMQCYQLLGQVHHETQLSEGGEADLHKYFAVCAKNPGHVGFIPAKELKMQHLPEQHQDPDLYELIRAVADLTVRVDVQMVSPHRPEFWPNTQSSYPFYNLKEKRKFRTGSGMVKKVYQYTSGYRDSFGDHHGQYTTCWCAQCQHSESPSNVWWEFNVDTATHVVFDDIEAQNTSLKLFYDGRDSPQVSLEKVCVKCVNVERDLCVLKCVTCDETLGKTLKSVWRHFNKVWSIVNDKYKKSRDSDKLTFMVSHPHGCFKQVSIGQWKDKYALGGTLFDLYMFTYSTCTCPGSSGASVHCVGYSWWGYDQHVHTGTLKSGLNYSCAGEIL
ncbi:uncharacterized protein LOC106062397 isoform X1 [Biomphalaria glabrata]|uniref:Uncharacterized protein LOC106062397 isoform X1 n=2 Tax=Biomphalaria glabrata TaxID=6526 RepID=A0A9U8E7R5_BIOGL|nr:uncharacterized protein LOC106062397 isoform X1 [Biomphalaria glabrata]XP_013076111.2 uncharacterized protein LOC106062397 isoform X1 [Biomphalaria glabrata]